MQMMAKKTFPYRNTKIAVYRINTLLREGNIENGFLPEFWLMGIEINSKHLKDCFFLFVSPWNGRQEGGNMFFMRLKSPNKRVQLHITP